LKITLIQGHPDSEGGHFGNALADAYARGARAGGHELRPVEVAELSFPLLRSQREFEDGAPPDSIKAVQRTIAWSDHLVIIFPLWLGSMPALLKGFLEQAFRPAFVVHTEPDGRSKRPLKGKSARVIVTMGMPALAYRWFFRAHGLKNLERNILSFVGIRPVRATLIGGIESLSPLRRSKWLQRIENLGARAG
jgi:putative NADPH-quinone reductase